MYLMDANAFMEASRLYYGFEIAPGFWAWLAKDELADKVASIHAVKDEISAGKGDLVDWATGRPDAFWLADSDAVVGAMRDLALWVTDPARIYRQDAIDEFLASADMKFIAHAMANAATIVTREQPAPESKKRVKIPDVCNAFGVSWVDPFTAYRTLGMSLGA